MCNEYTGKDAQVTQATAGVEAESPPWLHRSGNIVDERSLIAKVAKEQSPLENMHQRIEEDLEMLHLTINHLDSKTASVQSQQDEESATNDGAEPQRGSSPVLEKELSIAHRIEGATVRLNRIIRSIEL